MRLAFNASFNCTFTTANDFISHPSDLVVDLVRHNGFTWLLVHFLAFVLLTSTPSPSRDLIRRRCGHRHESGLLKLDSLGISGVFVFF